jgi:hypothetical protein
MNSFTKKPANISVFSKLLIQIHTKLGFDQTRLNIPELASTMVVGIDVVNEGKKSLVGLCSSRTKQVSQFFSQVVGHDFPDRKIYKT